MLYKKKECLQTGQLVFFLFLRNPVAHVLLSFNERARSILLKTFSLTVSWIIVRNRWRSSSPPILRWARPQRHARVSTVWIFVPINGSSLRVAQLVSHAVHGCILSSRSYTIHAQSVQRLIFLLQLLQVLTIVHYAFSFLRSQLPWNNAVRCGNPRDSIWWSNLSSESHRQKFPPLLFRRCRLMGCPPLFLPVCLWSVCAADRYRSANWTSSTGKAGASPASCACVWVCSWVYVCVCTTSASSDCC